MIKMCSLLSVLSFLLLSVISTQGQDWRCPSRMPHTTAMYEFNDICYQFVDEEKYWTSARDYCWGQGGTLVNVDSREVSDFLKTSLNNLRQWRNNGVWIGLHDRDHELRWKWVTARRGRHSGMNSGIQRYVSFEDWGRGHPGAFLHHQKDCIRMVRNDNWRWHETFCTVLQWKYRFICQYTPKYPRPTTTTTPPPIIGEFAGKEGAAPELGGHQADRDKTTETKLKEETSVNLAEGRDQTTYHISGEYVDHISHYGHAGIAAARTTEESSKKKVMVLALWAGVVCLVILLVAMAIFIVRRERHNRALKKKNAELQLESKPLKGDVESGKQTKAKENTYVTEWDQAQIAHQPSDEEFEPIYEECKNIYSNAVVPPKLPSPRPGTVLDNTANDAILREKAGKASPGPYFPMTGSIRNTSVSSTQDEFGYEEPVSHKEKPQAVPEEPQSYEEPQPQDYEEPQPSDHADYAELPDLPEEISTTGKGQLEDSYEPCADHDRDQKC